MDFLDRRLSRPKTTERLELFGVTTIGKVSQKNQVGSLQGAFSILLFNKIADSKIKYFKHTRRLPNNLEFKQFGNLMSIGCNNFDIESLQVIIMQSAWI